MRSKKFIYLKSLDQIHPANIPATTKFNKFTSSVSCGDMTYRFTTTNASIQSLLNQSESTTEVELTYEIDPLSSIDHSLIGVHQITLKAIMEDWPLFYWLEVTLTFNLTKLKRIELQLLPPNTPSTIGPKWQ